jgi:hypothetical protein
VCAFYVARTRGTVSLGFLSAGDKSALTGLAPEDTFTFDLGRRGLLISPCCFERLSCRK